MTRFRHIAACLALAAGLLGSAGAAGAVTCQEAIDQELQRLSVPSEDVESIEVVRRSFGAKSPNNYIYDAWVRLKSCSSGHLVVTLTKYCMVTDSYTRGGCTLPQTGGN